VYIFGYVTGKYSYGRIVSYTIIMAQICCAIVAVKLEQWLGNNKPSASLMFQFLLALSLTVLSADWLHASATRLLTAVNSVRLDRPLFNQISYKEYNFVQRLIPMGTTVLANLELNKLLPSFGAKVIAVDRPLAFVLDTNQREVDVKNFFLLNTSREDRLQVLNRYKPKFLLLSVKGDPAWQTILSQVVPSVGQVIYRDQNAYILISFY
jgi:hypothetical protein